MKEKHPIDSFFKEKLADRQYPMKEEYWSAAADLIEAQGGRKRRRFLWLFLLIGLLITGSTIGYYFSADRGKELISSTEISADFEANPKEDTPKNKLLESEDELVEIEGLEVYPNPATEIIYLEWTNGQLLDLELYDALGRVVHRVEQEASPLQLSISHLPSGMYFAKLNDQTVRKILID